MRKMKKAAHILLIALLVLGSAAGLTAKEACAAKKKTYYYYCIDSCEASSSSEAFTSVKVTKKKITFKGRMERYTRGVGKGKKKCLSKGTHSFKITSKTKFYIDGQKMSYKKFIREGGNEGLTYTLKVTNGKLQYINAGW